MGPDQDAWKAYDATQLILKHGPVAAPILIDQGSEDQFLHDKQLLPEAFEVRRVASEGSRSLPSAAVESHGLTDYGRVAALNDAGGGAEGEPEGDDPHAGARFS